MEVLHQEYLVHFPSPANQKNLERAPEARKHPQHGVPALREVAQLRRVPFQAQSAKELDHNWELQCLVALLMRKIAQ